LSGKVPKSPTIIINPNAGISYINESIRNAGFVGEVPYILNPVSLVLIRPEADLEDVIQGLLQTIENIKLQRKYANVAKR